ncbi:tyrosine-type recombinase/integrase [Rossellomorea marisflavi]|uniref:tyrosine-type recombinase/integrase n=1 Tax=Rossellomorea marisflavi TaxID=189381 RepID=UPI003D2E9E8A
MTKRKASLVVQTDLSDLFSAFPQRKSNKGYPIDKALSTVLKQMKAAGLRARTISDYELHVTHFAETISANTLEALNADHIFEWLSSMNVSNQTKLTRLKCLKAFLGRCFDNGWLTSNFWRNIKIKVDSPVKEGATDREIKLLLTFLDLNRFVELRDATAILLMYQTGIRVGTLTQLEDKHVNLDDNLLRIDGGIVKNHESLYLPFDGVLARLLEALITQNDLIRKERHVDNRLLFITKHGGEIATSPTNNNIIKRLGKYSKELGLRNINPHALRRGFAKKLLGRGANIALISKALGHSDIAVTTRYLHLDKEEVAENLRSYL